MMIEKVLKYSNSKSFQLTILISFLMFITPFLTSFAYTFINLDLYHSHSFSERILSFDMSSSPIGGVISCLLFTRTCKVITYSKIISLSLGILVIVFFALIYLERTEYNIPIRMLIGYGMQNILLVATCMQAILFKGTKSQTFLLSLMGVLFIIGLSAGAFLDQYIAGASHVFHFCIGMLFVTYIICLVYTKYIDELGVSKKAANNNQPKKSSWFESVNILKEIFLLFMLVFISKMALGNLTNYFPIYLETIGYDRDKAESIYAYVLLGSVLSIFLGKIADRFGSKKILLHSIIIAFAGSVVLSFINHAFIIITIFFIISAVIAAIYNICLSLMVNIIDKEKTNSAISILSMGGKVGYVIAPPLMEIFSGFLGTHELVGFIIYSFLLMVIFAVIAFMKKEDRA